MRLLIVLTLGYVGVLVAALAASLTAILVYLRRIGGVLGEVRDALARVREETAPLEGHLKAVHQAAVAPADRMTEARDALQKADEHLGAIAERPGAAETAR